MKTVFLLQHNVGLSSGVVTLGTTASVFHRNVFVLQLSHKYYLLIQ